MYFESTLTERNGEREYSHHYLIDADDFEDALEKIKQCAIDWYEGADVIYDEEKDCLSFFSGEVLVTVSDPVQTTLEKYFERLKDIYLIE
ncbi:hypothetical protein LCGC14_1230750 [marine sediment metagenome]|uniref:Uncharacterized protein n=1 Tax=marine sediment metagenome TaxID=412755 RepID=A0A0F9PCW5_9ZZZZ